jgi:hypothetical protein
MIAAGSVYPLIDGVGFLVCFFLGGIACGFVTNMLLPRSRFVADIITIFSLLETLCYLPVRVAQSYYNYHSTFREGWWVILWTIFYTLGIRVFYWMQDSYAHRRKKDGETYGT